MFECLSSTREYPWRAFRYLSDLSIFSITQQEDGLFQALQEMRELTKLELLAPEGRNVQAFVECMVSLTGLKSLVFSDDVPMVVSPEITKRLTLLTQLTQLFLSATPGGHPLSFPKGIIDLSLRTQQGFPTDLFEVLLAMTHLKSLTIVSSKEMHLFHSDGVTPFHFFNKLRQLKALTLWNAFVDRTFLEAFVVLTGLTELRLGGWYARMDPKLVCRQLSLLSNLQVLKIPFPEFLVDSETGMPQGSLPKLRTINLPRYHAVDANTQASLFEAFPCLRNVNTYRRSSTAL